MSERLVPIPSELLTTHCQKCNRMIPVKTSLNGICHKCYGIKSKWDQPIWYCNVCNGLFTKYELKGGTCFQCRENTKEGNLSNQRQLHRTEAQSAAEDYKDYLYDCQSKGTCDILHMHHHILQDDPERLSTKFIQKLIKGNEPEPKLNLPEEFKTDAEYAFDITTVDSDGNDFMENEKDFEYDLTLHKPEGVEAEVV